MIRAELPFHLRTLAQVSGEIEIDLKGPATLRNVIDAIELKYPALRGAIRDYATQERRPFLRFFINGEDLSSSSLDTLLPDSITSGSEPILIVGAIAGGILSAHR